VAVNFLAQIINHGPHSGGHMFIARPQQPQLPAIATDKLPLRQDLHDIALGQRVASGKQRQAADT
jgi:hypothetical protein